MQTIDFPRAYVRFRIDLAAQPAITLSHKAPTTLNNVRINLECRTTITDPPGKTTEFVLGAACKTERVGAPKDLWLEPNANFNLVASREDFLVIKSWQKCGMGVKLVPETLGVQPERQVGKVKDAWVGFSVDTPSAPATELTTIEEIIAAIRGDRPIVSRTEYTQAGHRVVIEHPVKSINYSERENVYQTDTGPVVLPDLSEARLAKEGGLIGTLDMAYSAFNARDWAEFIVKVPTALSPDIKVNHYSKPVHIDGTRNSLLLVD
jgi:hypothetical protein